MAQTLSRTPARLDATVYPLAETDCDNT